MVGVAVRFADAGGDYYAIGVEKSATNVNGQWQVIKHVAGVETFLAGPTAYTWARRTSS